MTPPPDLSTASVKIISQFFYNKVIRMVLLKILAQDGINSVDLHRALNQSGGSANIAVNDSIRFLIEEGMISVESLGTGTTTVQYRMTEFGRSLFKHLSLFCEQVDLCLLRRDVDKMLAPYTRRQQLEVILYKAQEKILQAEGEREADG